jgi:hypothetical protein
MNISKETITPKKAADWIKKNTNNRPLSAATVKKYAGAMGAGEFRLNGETIKFNDSGELIDGQHRLHACLSSGVAFDSYVVRGLTVESFDTIDQGRKRNNGDVLARRGEKSYTMLAAAVVVVRAYITLGYINYPSFRSDEIIETLEQHPGIRDDVAYFSSHKTRTIINSSLGAGLLYLFGLANRQKAVAFWRSVVDGENLNRSMVEYKLRSRLLENSTGRTKLQRNAVAALCVKSFNAYQTGKPLGCLKWMQEEDFPQIENFPRKQPA